MRASTLVPIPLSGCAGPGDASGEPVAFETYDQGDRSDIAERRTEVVRNQTAMIRLWSEHQDDPNATRPEVDFGERMVLAAFMGETGDCAGAEIDQVLRQDDGGLVVRGEWWEAELEAGETCTQRIVRPYHIVTVNRTERPVAFEMEETKR